jgi:hypothetical protein
LGDELILISALWTLLGLMIIQSCEISCGIAWLSAEKRISFSALVNPCIFSAICGVGESRLSGQSLKFPSKIV